MLEVERLEMIKALMMVALVWIAFGCSTPPATAPSPPVAAQQQLYLFQYAPGPAWHAGVPMRQQGLGPHAAYMQQLLDEGRLFAGGGYSSDDGGMAIVMAANVDDARTMLAADPAITSGVFVAELREWTPRFYTDAPLPSR